MPRVFRDIKYVYELATLYGSTWATNKSKVQLDLQENLDSSAAGVLRQMVNATGDTLLYSTAASLKMGIRSVFIHNKTYLFSINGIELQTKNAMFNIVKQSTINPVTICN